jgi:hypothetical protein
MSARPEPDQSPSLPHPSHRHTHGHSGLRDPRKLPGAVPLIIGWLAGLLIGIAIGNAARKRIDRATHGYS